MASKNGKANVVSNETVKQLFATINTISTTRRDLLSKLLDSRRDIDDECGYPKEISSTQYRYMFDREGLATKVVKLYPEESWSENPEVYEGEDVDDETDFEVAVKLLEKEHGFWHYLERVDILSGIGRFGVLLVGIDDGKELYEPIDGIDETGAATNWKEHKLIYLRPFDESNVTVNEIEINKKNPRYGRPLFYTINMSTDLSLSTAASTDAKVHWTRVLHVADNRESSEIYGVPRMQALYNRLYDIRKVLSGSGEMFWKGAFPGYAFEVNPELGDVELDEDSLKETVQDYFNGLQRYMSLSGMSVKSLQPQVAEPGNHIETQVKVLAMAMNVPYRVFMGTEEAKLAGEKDSLAWNRRLKKRQDKYLTPLLVRPFIQRLIDIGVLPEVDEFFVDWPDLNSPSDKDKSEVAKEVTEALAKYVGGNVDTVMPPSEFLSMVMGFDQEEVNQITKAAEKHIQETEAVEGEMRAQLEKEMAKAPRVPGQVGGVQPKPSGKGDMLVGM